tara:strand:- start:111 stop:455 length:345 start_codon:yes stop_codon:yes gene_type:complete
MNGKEQNKQDDWSNYSMLVLAELKRLNDGQSKISTEMDDRFKEINNTLSDFKSTIKDVNDLKLWKKDVTEVWSSSQMKEGKDEIYTQKGRWTKWMGILIGAQLVVGVIIFFLKK